MTGTTAGFDLEGLRAELGDDTPASRLRPIGLGRIHLGSDALAELPRAVRSVAREGEVVVLVDPTPMRRDGADLKRLVVDRLAAELPAGLPVRLEVLGADRSELHADERALAEADRLIAGAGVVVSVGSGTVTDIAKDASHRAGGIPFVVVQTAVSVNAFSDDMAVLLRNGVKRTVPSRWPDALVVDLETLADAPQAMNAAGFGELTAMFTAPADWYLATALGMDDTYDERVVDLYRERGDAFLAAAPGVRARTPDALAELATLMTLSGIAMGVAGRTAPFSGMEHTVSHLLDMAAESRGTLLALHGAQVGVATAVVSIVWRRVLDRLDPERLLAPSGMPSRAEMAARVERAFRPLDPGGRVAAECWRDYEQKLDRWNEVRPRVADAARRWDEHRACLERLVEGPAAIVESLRLAGAPARFAELDPPADEATARWALANCHLMRNRLTVADVATFAGLWDDSAVDEVLALAAELGGGL
jgi:glycerol-1-phosphate dehydrogenase [NAD(P)+]